MDFDLTPEHLAEVYNDMRCPVCGFKLEFKPWDGALQSDEICSGCGIQFGYDDCHSSLERRVDVYSQRRQRWIASGMVQEQDRLVMDDRAAFFRGRALYMFGLRPARGAVLPTVKQTKLPIS